MYFVRATTILLHYAWERKTNHNTSDSLPQRILIKCRYITIKKYKFINLRLTIECSYNSHNQISCKISKFDFAALTCHDALKV